MGKKTVASVSQIQNNWTSAMGAPQTAQKYKDGINRVTTSPMEAAATDEAQQRYVSGVQNSVSSGKRAAALRSRTIQDWKSAATGVGASRLASGADKGKQKYAGAMNKWQPVYQAASDAANSLPKGGRANASARFNAALDVMMTAAGK